MKKAKAERSQGGGRTILHRAAGEMGSGSLDLLYAQAGFQNILDATVALRDQRLNYLSRPWVCPHAVDKLHENRIFLHLKESATNHRTLMM